MKKKKIRKLEKIKNKKFMKKRKKYMQIEKSKNEKKSKEK
jgi:hypothetical protein